MDELIDIVTAEGVPTGKTALKSEIHTKGYYHNTVHIWFYTDAGAILLAQRAATKSICPLLWDVSVAGHVDAGESMEDAAKREVWEEIHLKIKKKHLNKIGVFECFQTYPNGIIDNEFHHAFIYNLNKAEGIMQAAPDEVADLKLVSANEFFEILETIGANNHLVASNKAYYDFVFQSIIERVT